MAMQPMEQFRPEHIFSAWTLTHAFDPFQSSGNPSMNEQHAGTALVTGAAGDVGKRYAEGLARRGYDLVLVGREEGPLAALASNLSGHGGRVEVAVHDLASADSLASLVSRVNGVPGLSLVANVAGSATFGAFATGDVAAFDATIAVNITALTHISQAAAARFSPQGKGAIVNFASVLAFRPWPEFNVYNASKAYVVALSQSMQGELKEKGVLVQVVIPPATATSFWEKAGFSYDKLPPQAVMQIEDLVAGALAGLDRREEWVLPSLENATLWAGFQDARNALVGGVMSGALASRYADRAGR
jgi:short-subunit dehydrogenase